jgi:O-antigen/teichoic acid export membrane protein
MARQIRTPIRQVRQSFDGMLTPILARTLAARGPAETGQAAASATRLILAIQLPMLIALVAIGEPLLAWFGPEFRTVLAALLILALAETIQSAMGIGDLILLYRRPLLNLWVTGASAAACLASAWWLIGPLGLDGAAMSVLIAALVGALVRRILLRARFHVAIPIAYSAGPIASGVAGIAVAAATLLLARPWPPVAAAALATVAGLVVYALGLKYWMSRTGKHLGLSHLQLD